MYDCDGTGRIELDLGGFIEWTDCPGCPDCQEDA